MTAPDSTPTEREVGDVGEVAASGGVTANTWQSAARRLAEENKRLREENSRLLAEGRLVLIEDDTAFGLAMQENGLLAGLRGSLELIAPRKHWRLYRYTPPQMREDAP